MAEPFRGVVKVDTTTRVIPRTAAPSSGWPSTSAASRTSIWNGKPRR